MTERKQPPLGRTVGELVNELGVEAGDISGRAYLIRNATVRRFQEEITRIGLTRDDASRDASSSEQEAKSAQAQVASHEREIKTLNAELSRARTRLAKAERDGASVEDADETLTLLQVRLESATVRRDRAADEAIELRETTAEAKANVARLDAELRANSDRAAQADRLLDPLEEKGRLLEEIEKEERRYEDLEERAEALHSAGKTAAAKKLEERMSASEERSEELYRKADQVIVNTAGLTELENDLLPTDPSLQRLVLSPRPPAAPIDPSPSTPAEALPDPTGSPDLVDPDPAVRPDMIDDDLITPRVPAEPVPVAPSAPESFAPPDSPTMPTPQDSTASDDLHPAETDGNTFTPKPVGQPDEAFMSSAERQLQLDESPMSFPEAPDPIVTDLDEPPLPSPSGDEFGFDDPITTGSDDDPAAFTDNDLA